MALRVGMPRAARRRSGCRVGARFGMITVASVDYCEQCKCRTLHIPLPGGERACENHPPGHSMIEVTCERCGKTLTELGVVLGAAIQHYAACRGPEQRER